MNQIARSSRRALTRLPQYVAARQIGLTGHRWLRFAEKTGQSFPVTRRHYAEGRQPRGFRMNVGNQGQEDEKPALEKYGVDLTARAKMGKLDPVIGRDTESRYTSL